MEFGITEGPAMGDQLTRNERLRLEALAQSVALSLGPGRLSHTDVVLEVAKRFERYIMEGEV
jgi:hypothetical protein